MRVQSLYDLPNSDSGEWIPVKVLAGEKAYPVHVDLPAKTQPHINVSQSDRPDILCGGR